MDLGCWKPGSMLYSIGSDTVVDGVGLLPFTICYASISSPPRSRCYTSMSDAFGSQLLLWL